MKLMSMKQYSKMTKASLVRKIMKALKKLPKTKLAKLCYELEKKRLPTISTTKKNMPRLTARRKAYRFDDKKGYNVRGFDQYGKPIVESIASMKKRQSRRKKTRKPRRRTTRKRVTIGQRRFVKGSPEAKRYMAKLRRMRR